VFVVPGLFTAIGLAPILFALDNTDERGAVLAALGLATVVSSSVHDQQVAAKRKAAKLVRSANHVGSGTQARREGGVGTEPPRPRDAAAVGPSSPRSLFRAQNLTVALAALWGALGANADLSAFDLYPSEADAIVADAGTRRIVRRRRAPGPAGGVLRLAAGDLSVADPARGAAEPGPPDRAPWPRAHAAAGPHGRRHHLGGQAGGLDHLPTCVDEALHGPADRRRAR
jgi:hypothetical protein